MKEKVKKLALQLRVISSGLPEDIWHYDSNTNAHIEIDITDGVISIDSKIAQDGLNIQTVRATYPHPDVVKKQDKQEPKLQKSLTLLKDKVDFDSSAIKTITYDIVNNVLGVQFYDCKDKTIIYLYDDVTPNTVSRLFFAKSIGAYFANHIKPLYKNRFRMVNFDQYVQENSSTSV